MTPHQTPQRIPKQIPATTNQTKFFYVLIGITAALILLVIYYAVLRQNSSLGLLYAHNSLTYFIWYISLTVGTSILFGVNAALLTYQWRRYGLRRLTHFGSGGVGALIGLLASTCPVCGSAFISFIGIVGSLSSLPFQGLEVKALSFLLVGGSAWYSLRLLLRKGCFGNTCPPEMDDSLKKPVIYALAPTLTIILLVSLVGWKIFATDTIRFPEKLPARYACPAGNFH